MLNISDVLNNALIYIEREEYKGYDPYDALKSPIFKFPFFRSNKLLRYSIQQIVKRSPVNLRPLFLIPKGCNPVTLGLCVQAYSYLSKMFCDKKPEFLSKNEKLIAELRNLNSSGYSGACWGYDFDWEQRYMKVPANKPTIVATGIITNALFTNYLITGNESAIDLCRSASEFVLSDLNRTYIKNGFCFSYSPYDKTKILNANMMGVRLLAQVYSITHNTLLLEEAKKALQYSIEQQHEDGSWGYSDKRRSIDNYHTGYVLECLREYMQCTSDTYYLSNLIKGFEYYKKNLFHENGLPKFYQNRNFPVDCTAGAQSIITLTRFNEIDLALKVAYFLIRNMYDSRGYFYFRKFKYYTVRTSFMRWSNAWMLAALSMLLSSKNHIT